MPPAEPNTQTLANSLAEQMRCDIIAAGLRAGDLFATEAEVERRYGVSRNIAREAVSQLRALGILKSRQGKGLIVARAQPVELLARTLPFYGETPSDQRHLAQWRYVLEIGAIELAVRAASEEQIARLLALADEYEALGERARGEREENEVELAFHALLLEMTGNPLMAGMHHLLVSYFHTQTQRAEEGSGNRARTVWQHHAIAEAIRQRDIEQARVILRQHLRAIHSLGFETGTSSGRG